MDVYEVRLECLKLALQKGIVLDASGSQALHELTDLYCEIVCAADLATNTLFLSGEKMAALGANHSDTINSKDSTALGKDVDALARSLGSKKGRS